MATIVYHGVQRPPPPPTNGTESRYEKERADRLELENAMLRGKMVSIEDFNDELKKGFNEIRTGILQSELKPASQDRLLRRLEAIKKNAHAFRPPLRSFFRRNV